MKTIFSFFIFTLLALTASAQVDTSAYPKERAEIKLLLRSQKPGVVIDCNDFISVGPKGDISFTREQWIAAQQKERLSFKSIRPIPGGEIIRIYEGLVAVVNVLIEVNLIVEGKDMAIKVRRLEVYHKTGGKWCRVAGQGTQVDERLFPVTEGTKP